MQDHTTYDPTPKLCQCGCGNPVHGSTLRFIQGHNSKGKGLTPEERFWKFVTPGLPTECWEWTGATRNGYGVLQINHKVVYAHRFSFELHHRLLADDECTLHRCDNRLCANPHHLFSGTKGDNARDMYGKGRGRSGGKKGQPHRKITPEQVRSIRELSAQGVKHPALAQQFGITIPAVSLIVSRKRWKNLP